jgi:tripartite ATP-independent transporter DctM subunit
VVGAVLFVIFFLLLLTGAPITMCMGIATFVALIAGGYAPEVLSLMITRGTSNFTLLAIPYFVLAGNLMNFGGITTRIFDWADAVCGHMKSGLAQVNVLSSIIFSGISGTATADAAGLGLVEINAMVEKGYDKPFSAAITLASSVIGPIIPPSVPFLIYAQLANVSVGKMFIAGLLPGLVIAFLLMLMDRIIYDSGKVKMPQPEKFSARRLGLKTKNGILALLAPVVLLVAISSGVATSTEAGIIAVAYSIFVGLVYKDLNMKNMIYTLEQTVISTALIMFLIGMGTAVGWLTTAEKLPYYMSQLLLGISSNKYVILLIINCILLILGCVLDGTTIQLIMVPILLPIIDELGVDRIQFGVIQVFNCLIGMATPPVGVGLFIMASITDLKMNEVVKAFLPFFIPLLVALLIITFVPAVTLFLPSLLSI